MIDCIYRPDLELTCLDRVDNLGFKHQILYITGRNDHSLLASKAFDPADFKVTFDLMVDSSYSLYFTELIYRTCHGNTLLQGKFGKSGDNSIQLGGGSAVAFDTFVTLFKYQMGSERKQTASAVFFLSGSR